jgi:MFS family permease
VPFAGRLFDRYGIRRVNLPALVLFAACLAALALFASPPATFVALYALMGVAAAGQTSDNANGPLRASHSPP